MAVFGAGCPIRTDDLPLTRRAGWYPKSSAKAREELLAHQRAHEAAKKGEADHPVIAARFARKAAKAQLTVVQAFDEWIGDKRPGSARKGGAPGRERRSWRSSSSFRPARGRQKCGLPSGQSST